MQEKRCMMGIVRELDFSRPFVFLNLKTYKESQGENAVGLAKIAQKVGEQCRINMIVIPQALDLKDVASQVKIPVYSQHADYSLQEKSTGSIVPESLLHINVHGSILNHSEKRLPGKVIEKTVLRLKELDMKSIVCVADNAEAKKIASFKTVKPDFIAVEPPQLIGGEISISSAEPKIMEKAVNACKGIPVIAGAGIKSNNDFKIALSFGCKGVLLSSHYVLSKNPEKFLIELVKGI